MKKDDQRTRLTKMLIRQALTALLRQKPIQSITIKELCAQAGINRGTFYAHYADIYDLMQQLEDEMMADFQAALEPLRQDDPQDLTPVKITTRIFGCIRDNADLSTVMLGPYGDKDFAARLLEYAREYTLKSYRSYFEHASPRQIEYYYAFVSAGCLGLLQKWIGDGMTTSAAEIAQAAEGIMLGGIHFLSQGESISPGCPVFQEV